LASINVTIIHISELDQMGVELGKVLAKRILTQLEKADDVKGHDSSVCTFEFSSIYLLRSIQTTGLIHWYQAHRKEQ